MLAPSVGLATEIVSAELFPHSGALACHDFMVVDVERFDVTRLLRR